MVAVASGGEEAVWNFHSELSGHRKPHPFDCTRKHVFLEAIIQKISILTWSDANKTTKGYSGVSRRVKVTKDRIGRDKAMQ